MRHLVLLIWCLLVSVAWAQPTSQNVTFTSGGDTLYGTLMLPEGSGPFPAAVLISGSGPTDRDGNSALLPHPIESQKHFAEVLASAGVASLRYDKLMTGKTGSATHAGNLTQITFDLYLDEAQDALNYLQARPEVDQGRVLLFGHSEGGLIALSVAARPQNQTLKALVLAAPMSRSYLDTIREQVTTQYQDAVAAGKFTQESANLQLAAFNSALEAVATDRPVTNLEQLSPGLRKLCEPGKAHFLYTANRQDPAALAQALSPNLPVLVMGGTQDSQVTPAMITNLMTGFSRSGNQNTRWVELPGVDHVFRYVNGHPNPNAVLDYMNPELPFSKAADRVLLEFIRSEL